MKNTLGRISAFSYGVICYGIFFGTFLYLMGFVDNLFVPKALDSPRVIGLSYALLINAALILLFGIQHSGMARKSFKEKWTKIVPEPIERSTYVLFSSLCLITLLVFWQPIGIQVWHIDNSFLFYALYSLSGVGWVLVFASTFMINHFDLFGLRQVYLYLREQPYEHLDFQTPAFYSVIRHPLYLGFLFGIWFTPNMTISHFVFAALLTLYMLIAIPWEEKDLVDAHGESYQQYKSRVPMLIPKFLSNQKNMPSSQE
ncbi:hypothetical protein Lepto7376_1900 [[Leptolyngbya] sp. PCC 7376]|uniref:methanethiol S-methyltransferase n=1 Tax=[Leptolyngbya] sp. PCC 7376 TaxID=111781 RepID=UPI00029F0AC7|nr:methanethiol S-methyltransferase [[Leptolyngbya] sp. PCC 7376]AFY38217.1 hypothetical protein Lepto7376_1900 [[Leptolyngbya] sp. PCC 7376]